MKLVINYDFIDAVKDVNSGYTPMKIVRNNKRQFVRCYLPIYLGIDFLIYKDDISKILSSLCMQLSIFMGIQFTLYLAFQADPYKLIAEQRLKSLAHQLNDLDVKTTYDLIKESNYYGKTRNLRINENKLPEMIESKYILVPSYDFKGDVVDTSIKQEHVVGSKEYVLSIGRKEKKLSLAYQGA